MRLTSILLLVLSVAAAGCTLGGDDDDDTDATPTPTSTPSDPVFPNMTATPTATPTPPTSTTPPVDNGSAPLDSSSYQLAIAGVPGQAKPGARFNFTLFANGTPVRASDHIGAHYADNDTTNPPTAPGRRDCDHQTGELPGTFLVNCTIPDAGGWHVWGHARINDSGELRHWWTPMASTIKVRDYNLTVSGLPSNPPTSRANFTFVLNVSGLGATDNATSDHIGAHYWNATEANPTVANAANACEHVAQPTGAIGSFTITCSIENNGLTPKDFFLRGHLRITEGGTSLDWWSAETKVTVVGVIASPLP